MSDSLTVIPHVLPDQPNPAETLRALASLLKGAQNPTIGEVIDLYLQDQDLLFQSGGCVHSTWYQRRKYLHSFKEMFGREPVPTRPSNAIVTWLLAHPTWLSGFTKSYAIGCVLACFRWAYEEMALIDRQPFRRPKRTWAAPGPREAITPEEFRALLRATRQAGGHRRCPVCRNWKRGHKCLECRRRWRENPRRRRPASQAFRVMIWALWITGARTCELRAAKWEDLDWDGNVLKLKHHKTEKATDGKIRLVAVGALMHILRLLWARRERGLLHPPQRKLVKRQPIADEHEYIFLNGRGRPWAKDQFTCMFRKYRRLAGIREEVSGYSLRHAFAVSGLEAGVGERQLADAMGHTTTKYIAWYGAGARKNAGYLNSVVDQVRGPAARKATAAATPETKQPPPSTAHPAPADPPAAPPLAFRPGKLQRIRWQAGLSQSQLAEQLGVSKRTVESWEHGLRVPKRKLFDALALALGVSVEELLTP